MAQRTQVVFTDDIDGSEADTTIRFAVDGAASEIDLSAVHAGEFRKAVQPFIDAARKAGGSGASRRAGTSRASSRPSGPSPSDVRAWAKDQGIEVKDKGRVPAELIVRFQAADQ
jgi:Lsr2